MKTHCSLCMLVVTLAACDRDASDPEPVELRVTIENVAQPGTLTSTTTDEARDVIVSPGTWVVHTTRTQLFEPGEPATPGLAALAEQGDGTLLRLELEAQGEVLGIGSFPTEASGTTYEDLPIRPGDRTTFDVSAMSNDRLAFAAMFIHSNDIFVATPPEGLELALAPGESLDVSTRIELWDAGTEVNEEPGFGPSQPMQGSGGEPEDGVVHRVDGNDRAGWTYPHPESFLRVVVERR